jgi:hypothetical protein
MNGLEARLHQGIHEPGKEAFTGFSRRALGSASGMNAGNVISDSNHGMSPSQIKASANVQFRFSLLHRNIVSRAVANHSQQCIDAQ